jgi:hypothetical protein
MLLREQWRGEKARSHFGRALRELGIEWIAAGCSIVVCSQMDQRQARSKGVW